MLISGQYIEDVYFMRCQASCCMTINFCGFFSCCTYLLITKVIYILSAFSLSLFLLLFSGFRTEIVLVSSYLRKPWRGGDSLLCTVQVRDVLQPGGGWLSASMHKNLGSGGWGQGEECLWIMPAGVKTSLWTHSLMPSFSIMENGEREEDHPEPAAMWETSPVKPRCSLAADWALFSFLPLWLKERSGGLERE